MLESIPAATIGLAVAFVAGFALTHIMTPVVAERMRRRGILGIDVHKTDGRKLPEMCGLSILIGLSASVLAYVILSSGYHTESAAFITTVLIAGTVGALDDIKPLNPRAKPILTALASAPILILRAYSPYPVLPFVGHTRLTIVYPLLIPFAIAIPSNAVNMLDVFNGAMTGSTSVITLALLVILIIAGRWEAAALAASLLACLLAFHRYNRYPAKVFGGDTGSLAVGAAIGALAILGQIEVAAIIALIPHIMNAFYGLTSVGRLFERREIASRPTRLLDDGTLEATDNRLAPVTLSRLILARGPLTERQVVRSIMALTAVSSALAVVTFFFALGGIR